ncbi:hypothetical protein [Streptomyces cellostaticus]|uniref:hypothetical protein n=1 Tax=Streptomyces cellostaticus TaxID=67285 RepID=UPI002026FBF8|nr:hypothetical protein [Streptomyces cellostaticus]
MPGADRHVVDQTAVARDLEDLDTLKTFDQVRSPARSALLNHPVAGERSGSEAHRPARRYPPAPPTALADSDRAGAPPKAAETACLRRRMYLGNENGAM